MMNVFLIDNLSSKLILPTFRLDALILLKVRKCRQDKFPISRSSLRRTFIIISSLHEQLRNQYLYIIIIALLIHSLLLAGSVRKVTVPDSVEDGSETQTATIDISLDDEVSRSISRSTRVAAGGVTENGEKETKFTTSMASASDQLQPTDHPMKHYGQLL